MKRITLLFAVICISIGMMIPENVMAADQSNIIDNFKVTVTAPASGKTPQTTASISNKDMEVVSVNWDPGDATFRDGRPYTVSVTVKIKNDVAKNLADYTYDYWGSPTLDGRLTYVPVARINDFDAKIISKNGKQLVIAYTFCPANTSVEEWNQIMLTNKERIKHKVRPLSVFAKLSKATDIRALEQSVKYGHVRPNGTKYSTIFSQVGIGGSGAENAAKGYETAAEATTGWINSSGHHRTMNMSSWTHMSTGFAKTLNTKTRFHWIQLFTSCGSAKVVGVSGYQKGDTFKAGTSIDEMGYSVKLKCGHGVSYIPLIKEMCSGYNPNTSGAQKIKVKYNNKTIATLSVKVAENMSTDTLKSASGIYSKYTLTTDKKVTLYSEPSATAGIVKTISKGSVISLLDSRTTKATFIRGSYLGKIVYIKTLDTKTGKLNVIMDYMRQSSANSKVVATATVTLGVNSSYAPILYKAEDSAVKFKVGSCLAGDQVNVLDKNANDKYAAIAHDGYICYILKSQLSY